MENDKKPDPQLVRYRGMVRVEQEYAASGMTDAEFAASMSNADITYTRSQVTQWRQVLNIPNNVATMDTLVQKVAKLRELLRKAMGHITGEDETVDMVALEEEARKELN